MKAEIKLNPEYYFFRKGSFDVLVNLSEDHPIPYTYKICGITTAHFYHIIKIFKDLDFITTEKKGRTNHIKFTRKGRQLKEEFLIIRNILSR